MPIYPFLYITFVISIYLLVMDLVEVVKVNMTLTPVEQMVNEEFIARCTISEQSGLNKKKFDISVVFDWLEENGSHLDLYSCLLDDRKFVRKQFLLY